MKSIGLFYFTGTQSSYYVAKTLNEELARRGFQVFMYKMEKIVNGTLQVDMKRFDEIGFVLPIYGFGSPRIVFDFIEMMPMKKSKVFILRTASDNGWVNQSASQSMINRLRKKWYDVYYDRILIMSSNWLLDFEDDVTRKLYEVMRRRKIPHIAYQIEKGVRRRHKRNFFREVLLGIAYAGYDKVGSRLFGRGLYANKNCTDCHQCAQHCPVNNITFEKGKLKAGWQCLWCMRCVYSCPENAIHSRFMDFVQFRNGFNYRRIIGYRSRNRKLSVNKKLWRYMEDRRK